MNWIFRFCKIVFFAGLIGSIIHASPVCAAGCLPIIPQELSPQSPRVSRETESPIPLNAIKATVSEFTSPRSVPQIELHGTNSAVHQDSQVQPANLLQATETDAARKKNRASLIEEVLNNQLIPIDWKKLVTSLALVIGGYLAFLWLAGIMAGHPHRKILPKDVVHVLGKTRFNSKQELQLIKLGSKLVLLLAGPEGAKPIGEVNDPVEVQQLIRQCEGKRHTSLKAPATLSHHPASNEPAGTNLEELVRFLKQAVSKQNGFTEYEA